jgi:hypothetical protein
MRKLNNSTNNNILSDIIILFFIIDIKNKIVSANVEI